jgi:hypothetical protein
MRRYNNPLQKRGDELRKKAYFLRGFQFKAKWSVMVPRFSGRIK